MFAMKNIFAENYPFSSLHFLFSIFIECKINTQQSMKILYD